ncbi:MAG: hypothetical protein OJF51_004283 [Nitrospira sp.]|nr:MAG: hypothetical protein OJF51_004283 [Nitrospira sp.]
MKQTAPRAKQGVCLGVNKKIVIIQYVVNLQRCENVRREGYNLQVLYSHRIYLTTNTRDHEELC